MKATPEAPLWEGRPDPAPYAWLDDDARMAGAISPGITIGYGVFFLAFSLVCTVIAVVTHHESMLWLVAGFVLLGAVVLRMGLARRTWRRRHPDVDPLSTVESWTDGSAFGSDRRSAGVMRWVLLVLCAVLALFGVLAIVASFGSGSAQESAGTAWGSRVLLLLLVLLFLAVARADWRRIRELRGRRRTES